jgi:hypothetical protein
MKGSPMQLCLIGAPVTATSAIPAAVASCRQLPGLGARHTVFAVHVASHTSTVTALLVNT